MERNFKFSETNNLIKQIKDIEKKLNSFSSYGMEKKREITNTFLSLYSSNYFFNIAKKFFDGKDELEPSSQFRKLILFIYQYKESEKPVSNIKTTYKEIEKDTNKYKEILSKAKNPMSWAFLSKKDKEKVLSAHSFIDEYLKSSVILNAHKLIDTINKIDNMDIYDAYDNFRLDKAPYKEIVKKIITTRDTKAPIPQVINILGKYKELDSKLDLIEKEREEDKDLIKDAINELVSKDLLKLLKEIPVEELSRSRQGIKAKTLKDAGYNNMADILSVSTHDLTLINGIGRENALLIKKIANTFKNEARKQIKIKISFDDKTTESNKVVLNLYLYKQKYEYYKAIDDLKEKYDEKIESSKKLLSRVGSGRFWPFHSDELKESVKEAYDYLIDMLDSEYKETINISYKALNKIRLDKNLKNAWADFKDNSIDFFNLLEEVCPGILGNDDKLYGLPEDLALAVQNEPIYKEGLYCSLRKYQEWGVKYILHQKRVLLGDEMGLGKTVQAIATMVSIKNTGGTHFVVVCPASVVSNWCREISKHSDLKVMMAHGSSKDNTVKNWIKTGGVIVTTFESASIFDLSKSFVYSELIVDEAHYIKNKEAQRTERVIELSKHADRILFMTGTALENRVDEMISLIKILNQDISKQINNIAFMSTAPQFREQVTQVYYRRKRSDVLTELPPLIEKEEWCDLTDNERIAYRKAILSKNFMNARRVSWNVNDLNESSKMNRLLEIIEEAKADDRKILVFSFFLDTIKRIHDFLGKDRCLEPINGSLKPEKRQEIVDEFEKAEAGCVLCAQIQSGGTGLNIQTASVVILCEPQLKPSIENQAISRAYRMGQSRNVEVFRLLSSNTIDERILELLKEKQSVFDAFADKSEAKELIEIDDKNLSDIINSEIERIKEDEESKK